MPGGSAGPDPPDPGWEITGGIDWGCTVPVSQRIRSAKLPAPVIHIVDFEQGIGMEDAPGGFLTRGTAHWRGLALLCCIEPLSARSILASCRIYRFGPVRIRTPWSGPSTSSRGIL